MRPIAVQGIVLAGCLALPVETITVHVLTYKEVHLYLVKPFTDMLKYLSAEV